MLAASLIMMTVMLLILTSSMMMMPSLTTGNAFAYKNNQATSQENYCGNGYLPTNVGCQNLDSMIQGDNNVVSIEGIQQFGARDMEEPEPDTATFIVIVNTVCVAGEECGPDLPRPSVVDININGNNPVPDFFQGSARGTEVTIGPGLYEIASPGAGTIPGYVFLHASESEDCDSVANGPIEAGEERTCTVIVTFAPEN
jgi:hypothetical protein